MAGKWKKRLKKIGKIAAGAGALALAVKLGKGRGMKGNVSKTAAMEDLNIGVRPGIFPPRSRPKKWDLGPDTGPNAFAAKGGRIGKKGGGRTGKQFGGGLNRRVARPIGGVGAPVRPLAYKHGGKVKSMGVAKRGGGIAKR